MKCILEDTYSFKLNQTSSIMKRIEGIVNEAAAKVKAILLEEAKGLVAFPQMMIGVKDEKHVDIYSRGLALLNPGILVYDQNNFWSENQQVIMMPDGLYRFDMSMFTATRNGEPTSYNDAFPGLERKIEVPTDYLVHGPMALYLMRKVLKEQGV